LARYFSGSYVFYRFVPDGTTEMHEMSLASNVVEIALATASQNAATKIKQVNISIGEYALVQEEQLQFCLDVLAQGTLAEGAKFILKAKRGSILCEVCGYEGPAKPPEEAIPGFVFSFVCPRCGGLRTRILDGRDVIVEGITVERETKKS
jgi:hydrogenase nickel incorporation protein HypA/HybF